MARSEYEYGRRRVLQASALAFATVLSPWGTVAGFAAPAGIPDEDGYDLWLRYRPTIDPRRLAEYRKALTGLARQGEGPVMANAERELRRAAQGLTGSAPVRVPADRASVVIGTVDESPIVRSRMSPDRPARIGRQGFVIEMTGPPGRRRLVIGARSDRGVLAGVFHLIRLLQLEQPLHKLSVVEKPGTALRMMNHWDNFDGSIERGYAGTSLFEWDKLPDISGRVVDYARSMASIADDADPITTADPADRRVQQWWRDKSAEIFKSLPGFGGFLVKANSEGQPGPLDYGRTHAEGANMLARTVAPHDGQIIWRSFVHEDFSDWAEYQYRVFAPLDGAFDDNVILQTKYGPIDFQIREPVHPLFGAMRRTNQMLELQLTQEYTGHQIHTTYLAPLWREVLTFPTRGPGAGPTVADILADGKDRMPRAGIAGVSNFGNARDWTGHLLGAANTYAFGRMCWNPDADPRDLAAEWAGLAFGHDDAVTEVVADILTHSRRMYEDYTSPLGMGYLTDPGGDHLDPSPLGTLFQSHHSTAEGTGFDRTEATGSGFTGLYPRPWHKHYESVATCPDELLLFMHWVPYDHRLRSGKTVIQHIYDTHFTGVDRIEGFLAGWGELSGKIDRQRHAAVKAGFEAQREHARFWRDTGRILLRQEPHRRRAAGMAASGAERAAGAARRSAEPAADRRHQRLRAGPRPHGRTAATVGQLAHRARRTDRRRRRDRAPRTAGHTPVVGHRHRPEPGRGAEAHPARRPAALPDRRPRGQPLPRRAQRRSAERDFDARLRRADPRVGLVRVGRPRLGRRRPLGQGPRWRAPVARPPVAQLVPGAARRPTGGQAHRVPAGR
ncbi:hypothetical protein KN815_00965 [Streptomyces sp. 4503]|uniref:Xylan alpha-1,2-glucuronidase n=1 Tax=Streptomyces niphimycinicus TaxID=2842201 RepID=A0ABS6C7A0_9ACTN|nr:alpha-glucuronidase family glycosyl hydrolase [Streptomyces niphimycinicus]MBU3862739.1 hypothetical protein [Streptomyces niphimycinicus]